jgi:hypothetical protein
MPGVKTRAAEPATDTDRAADSDDDSAEPDDSDESAADTARKIAPWLLVGGAVVAAVCVIKHQ